MFLCVCERKKRVKEKHNLIISKRIPGRIKQKIKKLGDVSKEYGVELDVSECIFFISLNLKVSKFQSSWKLKINNDGKEENKQTKNPDKF